MSEERHHFLKLWRENDDLKIKKATQERKLNDVMSVCNTQTSHYLLDKNGKSSNKFLQSNKNFNTKSNKTLPRDSSFSTHACSIKTCNESNPKTKKASNTALG